MTSTIDMIKEKILEVNEELNQINLKLHMISRIEVLIDMKNRNPEVFYQEAPNILKNQNIDPEKFFNITRPAIGDPAVSVFTSAFNGSNTKFNFETGEKIVLKTKEDLNQEKMNTIFQLNSLRAQLIKEENSNPLENIPFGDKEEIKNLFQYDPQGTIKRITQLVVESLNDRKKSHNPYKRGNINFRKTMKNSLANDGIPNELYFKNKKKTVDKVKPRIYMILDLSGSCVSFVPLESTLAYAFTYALSEYNIVIYGCPDLSLFTYYNKAELFTKQIKSLEKRNATDKLHNPHLTRLNDTFIMKNIKNPSVLNSEIKDNRASLSDYTTPLLISLLNIAPDNSIFIIFTDNGYRSCGQYSEYYKSTKLCNKFSHFKNNIFNFNLYEMFTEKSALTMKNLRYSPNSYYIEGDEYKDSLEYLCKKSDIPPSNMYPLIDMHEKPTTYDDWLQNVLKLIKKALI